MQKTISYINKLQFDSLLCLGVGVSSLWYSKLEANKKVGVDKYDKSLFPRLWTSPEKGIKKTINKGEFEAIIINDSKHYKDLESLFKTALKHIKEGGKIYFTHSLPTNTNLITKDFKPYQNWCGEVYEFILSLKAKGGYDIKTFDFDFGVTCVTINEAVKPQEIELGEFEDWYINRNKLMNVFK